MNDEATIMSLLKGLSEHGYKKSKPDKTKGLRQYYEIEFVKITDLHTFVFLLDSSQQCVKIICYENASENCSKMNYSYFTILQSLSFMNPETFIKSFEEILIKHIK